MIKNSPMPKFRFLVQTGVASTLCFSKNILGRACLTLPAPMVVGINSSSPSKGCLSLRKERLAKNFILSRINYQINISDVAATCSLSRSYFSRAFKKSTGLSPQQWVIHVRIEKARILLQMSDLSLTEIGLECGFSDQSHFTKTFSKNFGVPPKHWRRIHRMKKNGVDSEKKTGGRVAWKTAGFSFSPMLYDFTLPLTTYQVTRLDGLILLEGGRR